MSLPSDHRIAASSHIRSSKRKKSLARAGRRTEAVSGAAEIQWACERLAHARRLRLYVQKLIEAMSEAPAPPRRKMRTVRRPC